MTSEWTKELKQEQKTVKVRNGIGEKEGRKEGGKGNMSELRQLAQWFIYLEQKQFLPLVFESLKALVEQDFGSIDLNFFCFFLEHLVQDK